MDIKHCIARVLMLAALSGAALLTAAQTPAVAPQTAPPAAQTSGDYADVKRELLRAEARAKLVDDFANLNFYRDANARLARPAPGENRVVFIGDSITARWANEGMGGFFPGKPYVDRGLNSQTTQQILLRFRQDVVALEPKVMVICAGTNDIAGFFGPMPLSAIEDNLANMAELARLHGIRVVLASLLPLRDKGVDREGHPRANVARRPLQRIRDLNQRIRQYAVANGHAFVDYYTPMADEKGLLKDELTDDGLHPTAAGDAIMAPLVEQGIREALASK